MRRLLFLIPLLLASAAQAETAAEARSKLSGAQADMKAAQTRQKELDARREKLEREMEAQQKEAVKLAGALGEQEEALSGLEEKLEILETEKREKTRALNRRRGELSTMISAMIKLRRLPPEAVIAMPGKLEETLSTARALGVMTDAVEKEAASLREQLAELDALEEKIGRSRAGAQQKRQALQGQHERMKQTLKERGRLQSELAGKAEEEKKRVAELTAKSTNLQELVESLDKAARTPPPAAAKEAPAAPHRMTGSARNLRSFGHARGRVPFPVAGKIISRFGDTGQGAVFAKGFVIEAPAAGTVKAPYDGEVVYAGPFRDYGRIVIIRHSGEYHSLLSGLEEINCAPGQFLLEGEPIGAMGSASDGKRPRLYVELRKDGKPVDPAPWFRG